MFWDKPGDILFSYMYNNSTWCSVTIFSELHVSLQEMFSVLWGEFICLLLLELKRLSACN